MILEAAFLIFLTFCGALCLKSDERDLFQSEHNRLRSELAKGTVNSLPPAANLNKLVWDDELEEQAEERAKRCEYKHAHRDGQGDNLAYSVNVGDGRKDVIRLALEDWWGEHVDFKYTNVFDGTSSSALHFTQMAWANSTRLGCGISNFCESATLPRNSTIVICIYAPGGNMVGEAFYEAGEPCTNCAIGRPSCESALCALAETNAIGSASNGGKENNFVKNDQPRSDKFMKASSANYNDEHSRNSKSEKSNESKFSEFYNYANYGNKTTKSNEKDDEIEQMFVSANSQKAENVKNEINFKEWKLECESQARKNHLNKIAARNCNESTKKPPKKLEKRPKNYDSYCYDRIPSICELAQKYDIRFLKH